MLLTIIASILYIAVGLFVLGVMCKLDEVPAGCEGNSKALQFGIFIACMIWPLFLGMAVVVFAACAVYKAGVKAGVHVDAFLCRVNLGL